MQLAFHGGMCCAIKHIFNMYQSPNFMHSELNEVPPSDNPDTGGDGDFGPRTRFYYHSAPEERGPERLDRYLKFLENERPGGIVEIALATKYYDQSAWIPELTKRGFVEVTPAGGVRNSNTSDRIKVFHLYMKEEGYK